jgi:hypothetical protein
MSPLTEHVAAARELRNRYLEEIDSGRMLPEAAGVQRRARGESAGAAARAQVRI